MALSIEDTVLRAAVAQAVLTALPQAEKDRLIREALAGLLASQGSSYDRKPSVLELAFKAEAERCAREIVRAQLEADPRFKEAAAQIATEATNKLLDVGVRAKLTDGLVALIVATFEKVSREGY